MKDRLGVAWFINLPPRNPTQTIYTRFLRGPEAEIKTMFGAKKSEWRDRQKNALRTHYTDLFMEEQKGGQDAI
jgi:hypothetical protein